ncbi:MAG: sulfatase-like hydrolase/transferase [Kiritimatiellales bacterium]
MNKKANILLIVTDDQRYDTIRALGNPHINTPNLDHLAQQGFAFERHFCTTPICTPARAEILSGCNSFHNRVPWFGMPINPELMLMPQVFQAAGYHTIHIGKWHNDGHPRDKGYTRTRRVFAQDNLNELEQHGHWLRFKEGLQETEGHSTELFTEAAVEEIKNAPADRPWFCYIGFFAPHDPHHSPPPFDTLYSSEHMPLFPNHMPEHPIDNGAMYIRDEFLENWPREQDAMRKYRSRYYGMISHLDHHLGLLFSHLRNAGQLDNTLIVFTGDQGLATGSHGLLGKENMYDHSIASPLIFCGPGIPAAGRSRAMSHHTDLLPTLCDAVEIDRPRTATDGYSLLPVIRGERARVRPAVLCEFCMPRAHGGKLFHVQRAVRTERWKLIWYAESRQFQLFDLERDSDELVNLLSGWRLRHWKLKATDPDYITSKKNRWAPIDFRPEYTYDEIINTACELWQTMLGLMNNQGDPLPPELYPPSPRDYEKLIIGIQ